MNLKWKLAFVLLALAVTVPRWYYIEHFAVSLPFWDQWDSEWTGLLKPFLEGSLRLPDLWAAHNEHRILPTRLLTLATYMVTGSWNNLTGARLNIPLSAATPLLLIWALYKHGEIRGAKWAVVAMIVAGASLPFSWENFLIGFQSQFYFVNFFTVASLVLAAFKPDQGWTVALMVAFCVLAVLTVASGLLTPIAVAVVYISRAIIHRKMTKGSMLLILALLLISVTAYLTMPQMPHHNHLHAQNMTEFVKATLRIMGWPLRGSKLHIAVLALPALIVIPLLLWRRRLSQVDLLMLGCFVWTGMQTLALAYGRGHELLYLTSRYTEVLLLGLAGNSWFVLRAVEEFGTKPRMRVILRLLSGVFFCAVFVSYLQRIKGDVVVMKAQHELRLAQVKNVCEYLTTGNPSALDKPEFQIPYPDATRFRLILDDPKLKKILAEIDLCLPDRRL